jgi:hypothetical protein
MDDVHCRSQHHLVVRTTHRAGSPPGSGSGRTPSLKSKPTCQDQGDPERSRVSPDAPPFSSQGDEAGQLSLDNAQLYADFRQIADEQAALRRVATLVARAAPPEEVFAAVAAEAGRVLGVDVAILNRYAPGGAETVAVAVWASDGIPPVGLGNRVPLGGRNMTSLVFQTGQPARIDSYTGTSGAFGDIVTEAAGALDELGEIARGIHPAVLAERGLAPALKTLARRSAVPVDLQVHVAQRLPEPVEVSAYYVITEALTNAAKHARASTVRVQIEVAGDVLLLTVRDDGDGGAGFTRGTGLAGLKDRVEALGGRIFLDSPRGAGTSLRVELPLTPSTATSLPLNQRRISGPFTP